MGQTHTHTHVHTQTQNVEKTFLQITFYSHCAEKFLFPDACGFKGEGTEDGMERLLGAKQ